MRLFEKLKYFLRNKSKPTHRDIVNAFFSLIVNDETLAVPCYCPDVISTEYAHQNSKELPLVYIWNEHLQMGTWSFTVSVNGSVIGKLLEAFCPRSDPNFALIRDEIMSALAKTTTSSVTDMCRRSGRPPSELFFSFQPAQA